MRPTCAAGGVAGEIGLQQRRVLIGVEAGLDGHVTEVPHRIVVARIFPVDDEDARARIEEVLRQRITVARPQRRRPLAQGGPHGLGLLLHLGIAVGNPGLLFPQVVQVLVHFLEQIERRGEVLAAVVHAPERLRGAGDGAQVLEPLAVHRHGTVDEAGEHQPIVLIEEQDFRIDARLRGDTRCYRFMPAIDVFAGAFPGYAQHEPIVADRDLVVPVGESGEAFDLHLAY